MQKFLTFALAALSCSSVCATIFEVDPLKVFSKPTPYSESNIGFEMINKSKKPIWFVITNDDDMSIVFTLDGMGDTRSEKRFQLDIKKPTKLAVWFSMPNKQVDYGAATYGGKFKEAIGAKSTAPKFFTPTPDRVYSFTPGKTIYLTWDEKNIARPQSGPLRLPGMTKSILNKTDSNLSLDINVTPSDIKEERVAA